MTWTAGSTQGQTSCPWSTSCIGVQITPPMSHRHWLKEVDALNKHNEFNWEDLYNNYEKCLDDQRCTHLPFGCAGIQIVSEAVAMAWSRGTGVSRTRFSGERSCGLWGKKKSNCRIAKEKRANPQRRSWQVMHLWEESWTRASSTLEGHPVCWEWSPRTHSRTGSRTRPNMVAGNDSDGPCM